VIDLAERQQRCAELARTTQAVLPGAVDELHVAAALESRGVTDEMARNRYGRRDVFELAQRVLVDLARSPVESATPKPTRRRESLRIVLHGPLYMLPSTVYPAVFAYLGAATILRGMIVATVLGWIWGMAVSATAYQLRGQRRERAAGKVMQWAGAAGPALALLGATSMVVAGLDGPAVVLFMVCQVTFQLASGVLVFYEKELWLASAMIPACAVGAAHIALSYRSFLVVPVLVAAGLSAVLLAGAAVLASRRRVAGSDADPKGAVPWRLMLRPVVLSVCFAGLSAVLLLFTDARYVIGQFDLAIAVAPLVAAMGVVEWRATRFTEQAVELLHGTTATADFRRGMRHLALREVVLCLLVLAVFGTILLTVLGAAGALTVHGVLLVEAHVVLGAAFFLGFVLSRHEQLPALLVIMAAVVVVNVVAVTFFGGLLGTGAPIEIFLGCVVCLLILLLARLLMVAGRVYHYR
jgi:hypothetical protein